MDIDGIPVATVAYPKTVRLVSTARLRKPVLAPLVDDEDELAQLAEIMSARGLGKDELIVRLPVAQGRRVPLMLGRQFNIADDLAEQVDAIQGVAASRLRRIPAAAGRPRLRVVS